MKNFIEKLKIKKLEINKILIIRLGAIGDVLATTGLTNAINSYDKNIEIHYLTTKTPAQILENNKAIKKIILLEDKSYKNLSVMAKDFKEEKYDLIINLQPGNRTKYLCFLSHPKKVVTYKKTFKKHVVQNFFDTAKKYFPGIKLENHLTLNIPKKIINSVKATLPEYEKLVILNPYTSLTRQGRKWTPESFISLAFGLINRYNCKIIITGGKEDIEEGKRFSDINENIINLTGKYSLMESCALYSLSDIVISGDTGPLHLATATEKPVCIGLYGAAPIKRTGPWGTKHFAIKSDLKCVPCNKRKCKYLKGQYNPCLKNITPEKVLNLIAEEHLL